MFIVKSTASINLLVEELSISGKSFHTICFIASVLFSSFDFSILYFRIRASTSG